MLLKSIPCLLGLLFVVLSGSAQSRPVVDSSYENGHYKQRVRFFKQMPNEKKEIVFLGNSITEAGEWQELIPGKAVKNRGISGDVTYGVLARLDEVLASKPRKVFLLIGVNDLKRGIPVDTVAQNYQRIVERIKATSPKTKLYIQSVLPINEAMVSESYKRITNPLITALNKKLAQVATRYQCTYVNIHGVMADEQGQLAKVLTPDGIHLWPSSYTHWVDYLKEKKYL
jgi:lysophospholipase L1-like esterase